MKFLDLFSAKQKMSVSPEKLDDIRNKRLLENAIDVHFYWEYKHSKKYFYQKLLYVHNRNKIIKKFKIYYPSITDEEICKFIKLYLYYHTNENGDCFLKEKQLWI